MIVVGDMVKEIHNLDSNSYTVIVKKKHCEYPTKRLFYENKYGNNFNGTKSVRMFIKPQFLIIT